MPSPLHFPSMFWAQNEGSQAAYCLSQSGMPVPPTDFLAGSSVDIAPPSILALPALTRRLARLYNVAPEQILVTNGATGALQVAALCWFRPGARIAVETPSYEPYRKLPALHGADLRPLTRSQESGWQVDPENVGEALASGTGAGHVLLSNPNNPTGALIEAERLAAIADVAASAGGHLICGESFQDFLPNDRRVHAFDLAPNGVTIGSLTEAYGLGSLRIGWIIVGDALREEILYLQDMAYLAHGHPSTPSISAASRAFDQLPQLLQPLAKVTAQSRPLWEHWLRSTPGISCAVPEFGLFAFPRIEGVCDTAALSHFLHNEFQVSAVPGEYFGCAGHLRVGCGVPEDTLHSGLQKLATGIEAFRQQLS